MEIAGVVERVERITAVRADPAASKSAISAGLVAVREIEAWCAAQHAGLVGQLRAVDSFPEKTVADASKGSLGQATKSTERSVTLEATPSLAGALGDGAITAGHVDAVTRTSKKLEPAQRREGLPTLLRQRCLIRFAACEHLLQHRLASRRGDFHYERLQIQHQLRNAIYGRQRLSRSVFQLVCNSYGLGTVSRDD